MTKKSLWFIGILFIALSCKKDQIEQTPVLKTTPIAFPQPSNFPKAQIPADNPLTEEGVRLGRHLFYEKKLSGDNTLSCAGCHLQERNFSDPHQFSEGITGALGNKNAMILSNLAWQQFFFWDGRAKSLEEQALEPVENPIEMNTTWEEVIPKLKADPRYVRLFEAAFGPSSITKENAAKAIAQFERMLVSADSKYDKWQRNEYSFSQEELEGYNLFHNEIGDCFHCHGDFNTGMQFGSFGNLQFSNNGLDSILEVNSGREAVTGDTNDRAKFKIPSLRNVELSFPYMHDGRFNTLFEVIEHYNMGGHISYTIDPNMKAAGVGKNWSINQKQQLLDFLNTLTDESFLTDTALSDPFK